MTRDMTRRSLMTAMALALATRPVVARAARRSFDSLLGSRRMVRRFTAEPVSAPDIARLLSTAARAPSAGNTQPWAFVVVRLESMREALARAAHGQLWLASAPVAIVACADLSRSRPRYHDRAERYGHIDVAFASLLLMLASTEVGLGACFVGAFDDAQVSRLLGLPQHVRPVAIIPVGHPAESPPPSTLRPIATIRHDERW
jgi:nitroreductase